jgi:gluconokinase
MSCSALRRRYRDQLRSHRATIEFLHLTGSPELIDRRQAERTGHFMPPSLMESQFSALEPLDSDERGLAIDVGQSLDTVVETFARYLAARP